MGYRIGATTTRGRLFDAYWFLLRRSLRNAVACHYWLGSDVLDTITEARVGTLRRAALLSTRNDLHLADAPWLASELESVGIHAVTAHVPVPHRAPPAPPPMPARFSVLTYLAANRFEFYGGETILEVARRLPDVRFDVVGTTGAPNRQSPPNVRWHGWVTDMPRYYASTTVVVRIPRHDGLGETVVEGLLNARHVLYTHEVPFVQTVWPATPETLVAAIATLRDEHVTERLEANLAGRAYALEEFDEVRLAGHLAVLLRERA
jgi:glycosyltransferase involved in cell wall biosynthesis